MTRFERAIQTGVVCLVLAGGVAAGLWKMARARPAPAQPCGYTETQSAAFVQAAMATPLAGNWQSPAYSGCDHAAADPFVGAGVMAAKSSAPLPGDPEGMCAMLHAALRDGRWADAEKARHGLQAFGSEAVPALVAWLDIGSAAMEIEAVRLLAVIGDPAGLAWALHKIMATPVEDPAYGGLLAAFADCRSAIIAERLIEALGRTGKPETRERLLDLLTVLRGPEIVAALHESALRSSDGLLVHDSLDCLMLRRDPSETGSLTEALVSDDASVREAAAYGLAGLGNAEACRALADAAEAEPEEGAAVQALASVSSAYAQEALLALALDERRAPHVRVAAIRSLAGHSGARAQTMLANAVEQERNRDVTHAMRTALAAADLRRTEQEQRRPLSDVGGGELCF